MSYIKHKGYGLMGLGATTGTCRVDAKTVRGADGSIWPDSASTYPACPVVTATATASGGGWFDSIVKGATEIFKAKVTPAPVTQITTTAPSGMSTATKLALAGAAGLGLLLVLKSRKK